MGCISSKQARSQTRTPPLHSSVRVGDNGSQIMDSSLQINGHLRPLQKIKEEESSSSRSNRQLEKSKSSKKGSYDKKFTFSIRIGRLTEAEHIAAGWPSWLIAVAGEAVEGWMPLRSDNFERLEKIGEGTYSSVYRARDVETGKMVALKKVRFDNFRPESVRFMAREISILRRLDHPNIMKLEGIITSRLSCSIYFVFEYMEHDLSGLLSCPDIKFTDAQIKCYMRQLLCGIEHCHSQGVLHRDIKTSNILVNNKGILKIADFGLANFLFRRNRQALTSRVVTLWYRPPELLLGSTNYGASVDLWSVGCVFAELFIGRPVLKGRTEVEQLHKIFKLCGTPPDEYWKKSKLPLATMFKPQQAYGSTLRERCKELPKTAVTLIGTFLSIDPHKRGTASAALQCEYFTTKPYACDPLSLPKYPANKEIDARYREEARRKKAGASVRPSGASRNPRRVRKSLQESSTFCRVVPTEEVESNIQVSSRNYADNSHLSRGKGPTECQGSLKPSYDTVSEVSQVTVASQGDSIHSVPVQITASSGFAWAKRQKQDGSSSRQYSRGTSRRQNLRELYPLQESEESTSRAQAPLGARDEIVRHAMHRQLSHPNRPDSFDSCDLFHSHELSVDYNKQQDKVGFSGPLKSQSHRFNERQESHTRHGARISRFYQEDCDA